VQPPENSAPVQQVEGRPGRGPAGKVRRFARPRTLWLAAAMVLLIAATIVAFRQPPRPDPWSTPIAGTPAWWMAPIERNAPSRIPYVGADLHSVFGLNGGDHVWIVGSDGLILFSHDGGGNWRQGTIEAEAPGGPPEAPSALKALSLFLPRERPGEEAPISPAVARPGDDTAAWIPARAENPQRQDAKRIVPLNPAVQKAAERSGNVNDGSGGTAPQAQEGSGAQPVVKETKSGPSLNAVTFTDEKNGWAVGEAGTILTTGDGGAKWTRENSGVSVALNAVAFASTGVGWAVGDRGVVLRRDGQGWSRPPNASPGSESGSIRSLWLKADGRDGWAVGENGLLLHFDGSAWKSADDASGAGSASDLEAVWLTPDGSRGWAVGGSGAVLRLAGERWGQAPGMPDGIVRDRLRAIWLTPDASRGWAVSSGGTLLEYDGRAWAVDSHASAVSRGGRLSSVWVAEDLSDGWAVGDGGQILRHAGADWIAYSGWTGRSGVERAGDLSWVGQVTRARFVSATRGCATGSAGFIATTDDGGTTWTRRSSGTDETLHDLRFLDERTGWVVGDAGVIRVTRDGGVTWSKQSSDTQGSLVSVDFIDSNQGWALGEPGPLIGTQDGGETWTKAPGNAGNFPSAPSVLRLRSYPMVAIRIASASRAWAFRSGGALRTDDGGLTWSMVEGLTTSFQPSDVDLAGPNAVFLVGNGGRIFVTLDGGGKWNERNGDTLQHLLAVDFISETTGWAVGTHGTILATSDGGATWTPRTSGTSLPLIAVRFENDGKKGIAVASNLATFRTHDGGVTWDAPWPSKWPAPWYFVSLVGVALLASRAFKAPPPEVAPKRSVADLLVSDRPLQPGDPDPLDLNDVALGLSRFLRNEKTDPPLTIAVTGRWGSGKSSLMNLVVADLKKAGFPTVWFNAWHHQKEEHLLASLLETIRLQAVPPLWKPGGIAFRLRLLARRSRRRLPVLLVLAVAFSLCLGYYRSHSGEWEKARSVAEEFFHKIVEEPVASAWDVVQAPVSLSMTLFGLLVHLGDQSQTKVPAGSILGLVLTSGGALVLASVKGFRAFGFKGASLGEVLGGILGTRDPKREAGSRNTFATEFKDVTTALGRRNLLVAIDDLDRCRPENVAEVLEAVNFLVSSGDCFVVMGMDPGWVRGSIGLAYKEVAAEMMAKEEEGADAGGVSAPGAEIKPSSDARARELREDFARQYLEKLVNVEVPIPVPTGEESRKLLPVVKDEEAATRSARSRLDRIARIVPKAAAWILAVGLTLGAYAVGNVFLRPLHGTTAERDAASDGEDGKTPSPGTTTGPASSRQGAVDAARRRDDSSASTPGRTGPLFVPGASPRRQVWFLQVTVAGMVLLLVGLIRLSTPAEMIVRDSPQFAAALLAWHPLVAAHNGTPRGIKRFVNRVRYYAMCQRSGGGVVTWLEKLLARLVPGGRAAIAAAGKTRPEKEIPEEILVALGALGHAYLEREADRMKLEGALSLLREDENLSATERQALVAWCESRKDILAAHLADFSRLIAASRFVAVAAAGGAGTGVGPASGPRPASSTAPRPRPAS